MSLFYWSCSWSVIVRWKPCGTAESKDSGLTSIVPIQVEVLQILSRISAHSNTTARSKGLRAVARYFSYNTETTVMDNENNFARSYFKPGYYTKPPAVGAMSVLQWHGVRLTACPGHLLCRGRYCSLFFLKFFFPLSFPNFVKWILKGRVEPGLKEWIIVIKPSFHHEQMPHISDRHVKDAIHQDSCFPCSMLCCIFYQEASHGVSFWNDKMCI